ncbi:zinc knuckle CX2CX4HX4C containing protein [Tanacetum coccineum]
MMNSKGFFFFKFDSKAGLEATLENVPWMIRNTLIILKNWSVSTSLLKEELTRIPIWVKLHDVPLQVFEEDVGSNTRIQEKTQKESVLVVRVQRNNDPGPSNSLGFFRSHPSRRIKLGELWDCQLGNLTAGKDSGGGGK